MPPTGGLARFGLQSRAPLALLALVGRENVSRFFDRRGRSVKGSKVVFTTFRSARSFGL